MRGKLIIIALALGTITSCHRAAYNEADVRNMTTAAFTAAPTQTPQPTYLAVDYGKAGQPALAPRERTLVRATLAVVKPCQRVLLRYAFPENAEPDTRMVLFFAEPGKPIFDAHVLWQTNLLYNEGAVVAAPGPPIPGDIRNDIADTPCANRETFAQERNARSIPAPPALSSPEPTSAAFASFRVLHRFAGGSDGSRPSGLILANGELYGTTRWGGVGGSCGGVGCGTVFASTLDGRKRVVHAFKGPPDGSWPDGGLLPLNDGLYGTTQYGGAHKAGTVFAVSSSGRESVIYSFKGGDDGSHPRGDLVATGGNLYGTTDSGGAEDDGTVFEIGSSGERVLHSFTGDDGIAPSSVLVAFDGAMFGTTARGGPMGGGTIFRITPGGRLSVVYAFNTATEGIAPSGLTVVNGAMYGTTYTSNNSSRGGLGSIFKLTTKGRLQTLYVFPGGSGGENPDSLTYANGQFYGGTHNGGIDNAGTLFVATTEGRKSILRYFARDVDGANPSSRLVLVGKMLYGTLTWGGRKSDGHDPDCCGTLFALGVK
jgi:uncharacterized repeat protein (TIGR03803 family)